MSGSPLYATKSGTERYKERFLQLSRDHFSERYGLWMSSIGMGTYLGGSDQTTSENYVASIQAAVSHGCNVLDTAINYRLMQSEKDVGNALRNLFDRGEFQRDEIIVCTKGGFIAYDGQLPEDRLADLQARFYATGLASPMDIVGHAHCMTPAYLSNQIDISLRNFGLETIDVYYLHNPETQLDFVTLDEFQNRLRAAFEHLEQEVAEGRIRFYGVATWEGLRLDPEEIGYLPLTNLVNIAREVGGEKHHFRFIQFPYNLGMLEALTDENQTFEKRDNDGQIQQYTAQLLATAVQYGIVSISSVSLMQRQVLGKIPDMLKGRLGTFDTDAQYALQFNRSTPGLTTALVGMSWPDHVVENLYVAKSPKVEQNQFFEMF